MVTIQILYRGHSWCIILLHWGVANIASHPGNHNNCSDGYYWDTSARIKGKSEIGLDRCVSCYELCEFQPDIHVLLEKNRCHVVKECKQFLNTTFIGACKSGFILDIVTDDCRPCEYLCEYGFRQKGMDNICQMVCSYNDITENNTMMMNETIFASNSKTPHIIIICVIIGSGLLVGLIVPLSYLIFRRVSKINMTNQTKGDINHNKLLTLQENDNDKRSNGYCSEEVEAPPNIIIIDNKHVIKVHESESLISKHTTGDTKPEDTVSHSWDTEHYSNSRNALIRNEISNPSSFKDTPKHLRAQDTMKTQNDSKITLNDCYSTSAKSSFCKQHHNHLPYCRQKTKIKEHEPLSYKNQTTSGYSTCVSETPVTMDLFFDDEHDVPTMNQGEAMFSYTMETPVSKPISTHASEYSLRSNVTSIGFNHQTLPSMSGMSLYSYNQPDSFWTYQQNDDSFQPPSADTHSSVYSFKETVYTEDDLQNKYDRNDKNAPHIKGAEEHGLMTADEIELLPKDLPDIPDIQHKLQNLANQQYIKRIISNGRYIKVWYDALDEINASRLIGKILGVSTKHYGHEYIR